MRQVYSHLTKPIRLKGSREVRMYGGPLGDGHVILNSDGTFANTTPISMESIEGGYENVPEEKPAKLPAQAVDGPTAEVILTRSIGQCCDSESSRYALGQVQVVPRKEGACFLLPLTAGRLQSSQLKAPPLTGSSCRVHWRKEPRKA